MSFPLRPSACQRAPRPGSPMIVARKTEWCNPYTACVYGKGFVDCGKCPVTKEMVDDNVSHAGMYTYISQAGNTMTECACTYQPNDLTNPADPRGGYVMQSSPRGFHSIDTTLARNR